MSFVKIIAKHYPQKILKPEKKYGQSLFYKLRIKLMRDPRLCKGKPVHKIQS